MTKMSIQLLPERTMGSRRNSYLNLSHKTVIGNNLGNLLVVVSAEIAENGAIGNDYNGV